MENADTILAMLSYAEVGPRRFLADTEAYGDNAFEVAGALLAGADARQLLREESYKAILREVAALLEDDDLHEMRVEGISYHRLVRIFREGMNARTGQSEES